MEYITLIIISIYLLLVCVYIAKINTKVCTISISGSSVDIIGCEHPDLYKILDKLKPHNHGLSGTNI